MPGQLRAILQDLARDKGFIASEEEYASVTEMVASIREIEDMTPGMPLSDVQCRSLMENVRRIIVRTAYSLDAVDSVRIQSRLWRWNFLRDASPRAADAYVEVLRYFEIEPPTCLFEGPPK